MAKKKKQEEENVIEHLNENLTAAGQNLLVHKKAWAWAGGILVLCGLFFCSWLWFFHSPRVQKSFDEYTKAQTEATNDTVRAENLKKVADQYGSYASGKLASLEAGESLYEFGKYEEAVAYLKKFKSSNPQLQSGAKMLAGDCYVNLKKYDEALSEYDGAISAAKNNPMLVPVILLKKANVYREQKQNDKVVETYKTILADYPDYKPNGPSIEALLAREEASMGK